MSQENPKQQEKKFFGRCKLEDGGSGKQILYVPIDLFRNVKADSRDRDGIDSIARLFGEIFSRRRPLWATEYDDWYAVEMPRSPTDEEISRFAALVEREQP